MTRLARLVAVIGAVALSACASIDPVIVEETLPPAEPHAGAAPMDLALACPAADPRRPSEDGIGGTGCPLM